MMRKLWSKVKYPRLLLLSSAFLLAYLMFQGRDTLPFHDFLAATGYVGIFIAGVFFTYGFTAAPATAMLLILAKDYNIFMAALIGGLGALTGDLLIFNFIRHSFSEEFGRLSRGRAALFVRASVLPLASRLFRGRVSGSGRAKALLSRYFMPVVAGIIIASPLPDELGVSLLAASRAIRTRTFTLISYILNTAGILSVLYIGTLL